MNSIWMDLEQYISQSPQSRPDYLDARFLFLRKLNSRILSMPWSTSVEVWDSIENRSIAEFTSCPVSLTACSQRWPGQPHPSDGSLQVWFDLIWVLGYAIPGQKGYVAVLPKQGDVRIICEGRDELVYTEQKGEKDVSWKSRYECKRNMWGRGRDTSSRVWSADESRRGKVKQKIKRLSGYKGECGILQVPYTLSGIPPYCLSILVSDQTLMTSQFPHDRFPKLGCREDLVGDYLNFSQFTRFQSRSKLHYSFFQLVYCLSRMRTTEQWSTAPSLSYLRGLRDCVDWEAPPHDNIQIFISAFNF
jgi:hypothetical protein